MTVTDLTPKRRRYVGVLPGGRAEMTAQRPRRGKRYQFAFGPFTDAEALHWRNWWNGR